MDRKANAGLIALLGVAAAIVLVVVLRGGDEQTATTQSQLETIDVDEDEANPNEPKPAEPSVPVIEVKGGEPIGGVQELSYDAGDRIRFVVESDVADEVHLHGYDVEQPVKAGGKTTFDLLADIEGVFEVEVEERVVPIAEITVNPS